MELNRYIDHTLLKPAATRADIAKLCAEAQDYRFASVCVNSAHIAEVAAALAGTDVTPCCVVGFPLGAMETEAKAFEAARAAALGAREIDMVMDIGAAKEGDFARVEADIAAVVSAIQGRAKLKVILECCLLTDEEKTAVCLAAKRAGADFVKTSTGFSTGGATEHDVALMRAAVGDDMGVKASGGIRTRKDALRMIAAGASRIGASAGIAIVTAKD